VFRLTEDRGVINRYGFNSHGAQAVLQRLRQYKLWTLERNKLNQPPPQQQKESESSSFFPLLNQFSHHRQGPLGINLGKNKAGASTVADYVYGVETLGQYADYIVINISSPNTPGLRALQSKQELATLVSAVLEARNRLSKQVPLLVKIAPDLTIEDMRDIADVALALHVDGLIVTNTTIERPRTLKHPAKHEAGGLSGAPLREKATAVLHSMFALTKGKVPLIGVGGVATGADAYEKIRAGASLVQVYSCLVYDGPLAVV
jgi:dihydroorotate dehydrogenase